MIAWAIKYTVLGGLIYATMAMYLMAFAMSILASVIKPPDEESDEESDTPPAAGSGPKPKRLDPAKVFAHVLFGAGFALALAACITRAIDVQNAPLQNLFEAFLVLMVLIWPISLTFRWLLGIRGQTWDMLVAAALCIMPGFIRDAEISPARPAMQTALFVPHVLAYMIATIVMVKATILAIGVLIWGDTAMGPDLPRRETATYRMMCIAFPFMTMGLILGCIWAKYAWNDFWSWDPKEQWSLATWMTFVAYFHMRYMFGRKYPRLNAAIAIACMAVLLLTLFWANLSKVFKGIHSYA